MEEEEYFEQRFDNQMDWYSKKSSDNQKMYKGLKTFELISASLIPFLSGVMDKLPYAHWVIAFLGISIAILSSVSSLYKYHENWLTYRSTSEALKHEKILYLTQVVPYNIEDKERFELLVSRAENIMSNENSDWIKYTKSEDL